LLTRSISKILPQAGSSPCWSLRMKIVAGRNREIGEVDRRKDEHDQRHGPNDRYWNPSIGWKVFRDPARRLIHFQNGSRSNSRNCRVNFGAEFSFAAWPSWANRPRTGTIVNEIATARLRATLRYRIQFEVF